MISGSVLVLSGGVGGAKLAEGVAQVLPVEKVTIVVNTGDDFKHLGLSISPDLDSVSYMLADLADDRRGWGRKGETWACMSALAALGGEDWFQLGDRDLALHLHRTQLLARGASLSEVTGGITARLGIRHTIVPMTDQPVSTVVDTADGELPFQDYFVRHQCVPVAKACRYKGIESATASARFIGALHSPGLAGVIIAPSNPFLSIGPILALPGIREAIAKANVPVLAVSPLIHGQALKGPAAKLMSELAYESSTRGLARFYKGVIDRMVVDPADVPVSPGEDIRYLAADIVMKDAEGRRRLAEFCIDALFR